jgi:hypothetical protein
MSSEIADNSSNIGSRPRNLSEMKKNLTKCRNYFRERTKFIGGVKNV